MSFEQYPLRRRNGYLEIPPTPGSEPASRDLPEYRSMIGAVDLDGLVTLVAGQASANQRPSRHLVRDVLTSKGVYDITLTIKVRRDVTREHLEPGRLTGHRC